MAVSDMLRISGRGEDGTAKAIRTDDSGNLRTRLIGGNIEQQVLEQA